MSEKLQKVLAQAGFGSRRKMEQAIEAGRVLVNGKRATLGVRVVATDKISLDGQLVTILPIVTRVLIYNKPVGEICTYQDPQGRPTIYQHLPVLTNGKWISVGRLDVQTEGLIILTNSGALAQQLMHPRSNLIREYDVRVRAKLDPQQIKKLTAGVDLEDGKACFDQIQHIHGKGANHWYRVSVHQGRNRIVRRLFESQQVHINRLLRVAFGPVILPSGLAHGRFVELNSAEITKLFSCC